MGYSSCDSFSRPFLKNWKRQPISTGQASFVPFGRLYYLSPEAPIITLGIITFLASWNDFLWPLLILGGDRKALTLPVGLATLQGQYTFDYGKLMAGALVLTIPVLILYGFFQRYIIRSISMTGIKG